MSGKGTLWVRACPGREERAGQAEDDCKQYAQEGHTGGGKWRGGRQGCRCFVLQRQILMLVSKTMERLCIGNLLRSTHTIVIFREVPHLFLKC